MNKQQKIQAIDDILYDANVTGSYDYDDIAEHLVSLGNISHDEMINVINEWADMSYHTHDAMLDHDTYAKIIKIITT